jgi:N-acetylated-alpha-linked acidic dipeptidase
MSNPDEADNRRRRGTQADFQVLKDAGIELEGKLAMANYGGIYRGTKVKNAQDNGMAGCILFTDPMDDGQVTEKNGYEAYPSKHFYSLDMITCS